MRAMTCHHQHSPLPRRRHCRHRTRILLPIRLRHQTEPALTVRRRRSTIPRILAAVKPVKGTSRNGIRPIAITGTTDGAPETSVVAAGSGSRTDRAVAEEEAVRAVKAAVVENRHRAHRSLR